MPIVDTATNGWQRVGVHELGWRKSLRAKHWAQVQRSKSGLGWDWVIFKADPVTMVPNVIADGMDTTLAAAKDDVDHWNDHYHAHAVVVEFHTGRQLWLSRCRICHKKRGVFEAPGDAADDLIWNHPRAHAECEAAWQQGER